MAKGSIGRSALSEKQAKEARAHAKKQKRLEKLAQKRELSQKEQLQNYLELCQWVKTTRPRCLRHIQSLKIKGSATAAIEAIAVSRVYANTVLRALQKCGDNKLAEELTVLLSKNGGPIIKALMGAEGPGHTRNRDVEAAISKAMKRVNLDNLK